MSRTLIAWFVLLAFGAFTVGQTAEGEAKVEGLKSEAEIESPKSDSDVEALRKKIAELEAQNALCETRLAQAGALETEAQTAYGEINRLVEQGQFDQAKAKLADFQKKYGQTRAGKMASNVAPEIAVLGKDAPKDWGIEKWFQGESQVDLAGKKTTLLVFWETWCPHCRREMPKLQQVYTQHKEKGLQVVALTKVSKSSTEATVDSFLKENKVDYAVAKENGTLSSYFNVAGIPAAAVIKDGKVVWRGHPSRLTDDMLKRWL